MSDIIALPSPEVSTITPAVTLNLKDVEWVSPINTDISTEFIPFGAVVPEDDKQERPQNWRKIISISPGSNPDELFPEQDSNGNPCRVMVIDPNSGHHLGQHHSLKFVVYPNGHTCVLPSEPQYTSHRFAKMCHFALAALAAWPEGEARPFPTSWHQYNRGGSLNAAKAITPVMWERATIQGYLQPMSTANLNPQGDRIRTSRPVEVSTRRRRLKSSAWPFSEKEHWFRIMSGTLQITHNNMIQVFEAQSTRRATRGSRSFDAQQAIKKSFPVFKHNAEFKRSRKFFENLTEKKNRQAARLERDSVVGMAWDPLKEAISCVVNTSYSARKGNEHLFSSAYALIKTSMMLSCVPLVTESGSIQNFQEITTDYVESLKSITPIPKSVIGLWKGRNSYSSDPANMEYNPYVFNAANIDNLTHMYMILLNEAHLLSNEDLLRWCDYQGLTVHKQDFNTDFVPSNKFDVFGYRLTDTLDYTCIVWHKSHVSTKNKDSD